MNKHYACSDLHGMWSLWEQISNYCDNTDVIYFLGDAADRGPDGLKIIKALLIDKRVRYIKGNHEELLIDAIYNYDASFLYMSGGSKTFEDFINLNPFEQDRIITKLDRLPVQLSYVNKKGNKIILNHSGFFNNSDKIFPKLCLWDRDHVKNSWGDTDENIYVVHGHTPTIYVMMDIDPDGKIFSENIEVDKILNYCNGHKFDLDIASPTTKKAALFDLDTLKVEKYFVAKENYL